MSFHVRQALIASVLVAAAGFPLCSSLLSANGSSITGYAPQADPLAPITVGPRDAVGKPSVGSKVAGGLLGGVLGSSGGDRGERPRTHRDPTRRIDFVESEAVERDVAHDVVAGARAAWEDGALLVSTRVEKADDKGTFQTIFLQTCDGRRLYPQRHELFDLWSERSLSVSWSRSTAVDGRVVRHETGGWDDSWTGGFDGLTPDAGVPPMPATWQQLGFDRAEGGARQLGSYFNMTPETLAELREVSLYAHTTLPGREPVTTAVSRWLLRPGVEGAVNVIPDEGLAGVATAWQDWAERCEIVSPVLLAAAGGQEMATTLAGGDAVAGAVPGVRRGYPLPEGVSVSAPRGTGRTTGHIATINVRNDSDLPVVFPAMAFYIPASGKYQGYVAAPGPGTTVPPGQTVAVPLEGYCGDVRRPPVPVDDTLPPVDDWIVVEDPSTPITVPPREGVGPAGNALIPGTGIPLPRAVDPDLEPLVAAPLLVAAVREIERATEGLQQEDALITPFSGDPDREREAVVQQTLWIFASELENEPYTEQEFTERLEAQYEQNTGVPITAAPPEDQERVQQGADDFWGAFQLVGAEAKVISHPEGTTDEPVGETVDTDGPPPEEPPPPAPACKLNYTDDHTPPTVHVIVSDSYGNEDDRTKIRNGIRKAVEENQEAYATSTPPSTAYSLWGHDHIGGYSSAYAKSVFLEENRQEFVWWTDPLETSAKGHSTHTMTAEHDGQCSSVIAGAALKWIKASSEALDPLERTIDFFRVLDWVKEESVKYSTKRLPPGLDDLVEEGVDIITDPSSDTHAGATGDATITVGDDEQPGTAANRVHYKRADKEDKAITGGGAAVARLFASDAKPGSLTSKLEAEAELTAGAEGNGFAKAWLESLYGTILIGVCECPDGLIVFEVKTDSGLFIKSDVAAGVAKVAQQEMQKIADEIEADIASGEQDIDAQSLEDRAAEELRRWGDARGGDRFQAEDGRDPGE
jgi:hypothetical protein